MYIVVRIRHTKTVKEKVGSGLKKNHLRGKENEGGKEMDKHKQKGKK